MNVVDPNLPYSAPSESSLVWLRTIATGTPSLRALSRARRILPDPPEKHVVSKIHTSNCVQEDRRQTSKSFASAQESRRRMRGDRERQNVSPAAVSQVGGVSFNELQSFAVCAGQHRDVRTVEYVRERQHQRGNGGHARRGVDRFGSKRFVDVVERRACHVEIGSLVIVLKSERPIGAAPPMRPCGLGRGPPTQIVLSSKRRRELELQFDHLIDRSRSSQRERFLQAIVEQPELLGFPSQIGFHALHDARTFGLAFGSYSPTQKRLSTPPGRLLTQRAHSVRVGRGLRRCSSIVPNMKLPRAPLIRRDNVRRPI
jgi:plasmid stabilization system protein ParE